jgi:hypothetical protein
VDVEPDPEDGGPPVVGIPLILVHLGQDPGHLPQAPRSTGTSTSFGHFSRASRPQVRCSASVTATPASRLSQAHRACGTGGRSSTETGDRRARRRRPAPVQAAAAGPLVVGREHEPLGLAGAGALGEVRVGGAGGGDDVDGAPRPAGRRGDRPAQGRPRSAGAGRGAPTARSCRQRRRPPPPPGPGTPGV